MPSLANRALQLGVLSSIASRPLSPAINALAVSISACRFMVRSSRFVLILQVGFDHPEPFVDAAPNLSQHIRRNGVAKVTGVRNTLPHSPAEIRQRIRYSVDVGAP